MTIRRPGKPTNDGGVPVPPDPQVVYRHEPAEVNGATASNAERVFGGTVAAVCTHVVVMRYLDGVLLTDELVWHHPAGDRTLRITGRHEDTARRELTLAAQELAS